MSPNAEQVARDAIRAVRSGKIVNFQKLQIKNGYTKNSAKAMKAKKTKTFKRTMEPFTKGLWREIEKIKAEMESRDITAEKYETLASVLGILVKNYQLLSGNATEIIENKLSQEQQAKLDAILNDK